MSHYFLPFVVRHHQHIETALSENLPYSQQRCTDRFNEALWAAVFPGGKRWRPVLTVLSGSIVGASLEQLTPAACAIEYLHSSSMIIDDLPAMDDADLRRGKPSLHLAYNESTALLVSLALLNRSYGLLVQACRFAGQPTAAARLINEATEAIGSNGMIGGQVVDLEIRGDCAGPESLMSRNLKTTALMRLMMTAGAIAVGARETEILALARFGEALGTAYQICDDLLDEIGEVGILGKTTKQDQRHLRPNYVTEYGVVGAQALAQEIMSDGLELLRNQFGEVPEVAVFSEAVELILESSSETCRASSPELVAAS